MDVSHLPNVSGLLVTADQPARTDLSEMDHARCAALHNYLVQYAWYAELRAPAGLRENSNTFFTAYGAAAEALRPRLDPSLAAFLDAAMLPPTDTPDPAPLFFWASDLSDPEFLFDNEAADLHDEPEDSLVRLYFPNVGQGGSFGSGLFYHQRHHRAAVLMDLNAFDYALPLAAHPELWHPLETVLSNWIGLIRIGKICASPRDRPSRFGSEKIGPWEWLPYSDAQVTSCVAAWDRLCSAIEARLPNRTSTPSKANPPPLLPQTTLTTASIPSPSFAHAFLTRARRPSTFRFIAPGLLLPPSDAAAFAALQPFTGLSQPSEEEEEKEKEGVIPPVCLFPAAEGTQQVDLPPGRSPFWHGLPARAGARRRVPAGVYSEGVDRRNYGVAEEGFRVLLPGGCQGARKGRKSDGSVVGSDGREALGEVFQHGYKPFGGDVERAQRLERLLEFWGGLVEEGVWRVGAEGVEGGVGVLGEGEYRVPVSW